MGHTQWRRLSVITGDFVTTEDGTGIVHIAPTFGADDDRVAKQNGIAPLLVTDKDGKLQPLVDKKGRFFLIENMDPAFVASNVNTANYSEFAGRYVKNEYDETLTENDATVDIDISVLMKKENKVFKVEKHVHSYPHCWGPTSRALLSARQLVYQDHSRERPDDQSEQHSKLETAVDRYRSFRELAGKSG
jgi:isoleucyl-tRNA synthetase